MINHNRDLVKTGRANGTLCRGHSLKMKPNYNLRWKNWDGKEVITVSVKNIEYIVCEEWQDNSKLLGGIQDKVFFKLKPKIVSENIPLKIIGHNMGKLTSFKVMQFPVNSDIATTGHKLKGQTKKF